MEAPWIRRGFWSARHSPRWSRRSSRTLMRCSGPVCKSSAESEPIRTRSGRQHGPVRVPSFLPVWKAMVNIRRHWNGRHEAYGRPCQSLRNKTGGKGFIGASASTWFEQFPPARSRCLRELVAKSHGFETVADRNVHVLAIGMSWSCDIWARKGPHSLIWHIVLHRVVFVK